MDNRVFELVATCFQTDTHLDLFGIAGYQITEIREDRVPTRKTQYATAFSPDELEDERSVVKLCSEAISRGLRFFRREVIGTGYATADEIELLTICSDIDLFRVQANHVFARQYPHNEHLDIAFERLDALEESIDVNSVVPISNTEEMDVQDHFEVYNAAKKDVRLSPEKAGGRWMGKSEYYAETLNPDYPLPLKEDR